MFLKNNCEHGGLTGDRAVVWGYDWHVCEAVHLIDRYGHETRNFCFSLCVCQQFILFSHSEIQFYPGFLGPVPSIGP